MDVICISDTHLTKPDLPEGDVLVHAGDMCRGGDSDEFHEGMQWLGTQPHPIKIFVPGNHDRFAMDFTASARNLCEKYGITMLIDEGITIHGIRFHGSPWTRSFGNTRAFMVDEDLLTAKFDVMPRCDFLITHSPPAAIFDEVDGIPVGSAGLITYLERVKPSVHVFGHIHVGHGKVMRHNHLDGRQTLLANVCMVDKHRVPVKYPALLLELKSYDGGITIVDRRPGWLD